MNAITKPAPEATKTRPDDAALLDGAVDRLDSGLDLLRTAWVALMNPRWLDEASIFSTAATIDKSLQALDALRNDFFEADMARAAARAKP